MENSAYVPPFPPRPLVAAKGWRLITTARRNMLAIWPDHTYESGSFSYKVLRRRVHVVSTPDVVREVFVDKAAVVERKSLQQRHALAPLVGDGLIISDGDVWRSRRRIIAPITHISRLPQFAPAMVSCATRLSQAWSALPEGAEVDVLSEMAHLTAGIIIDAIFGPTVNVAAAKRIVAAFSVYQSLISQVDILSFLGLPDVLPRLQGVRVLMAARHIKRNLDALIDEVLSSDSEEISLLRRMAAATEDGRPALDRNAFRNEAAVMFLAGHETTANTLAWAFFILSQDASSEARLHAEIDAVLGENPARFEDLERLPFTRAVIQETLRLYPPVPIQARTAAMDFAIGQTPVKAGDLIMLNAWLLHRNRNVWSDPDAFSPDRFMPGGSGAPSRYAYVPFSIGPRTCTGAAFGQTEAILCLATLARRFRPRLRQGWTVDATCRLSLRPGEKLPMSLERRSGA